MTHREPQAGAADPERTLTALESPAASPTALYEAGLGHMQAQRYLDAQLSCQQALVADGNHAPSLHLMGLLAFQAGQADHALEWLARAIRQEARPEYLASLGSVLQQQQRHDEALKALDTAVKLRPDDAELWRQMGNLLAEQQRLPEAVLSLQHALKLDPRNVNAANRCGIVLHELGRFEEAAACFARCDELLPNHAAVLHGRARALIGLERFEEALADGHHAYARDAGNAEICNTIAIALHRLGRHDEELAWLDRALALRPDHVEALSNKAHALGPGRSDDALALFDRALALQPDHVPVLLNKAVKLSELHRFEEACATFERVLDIQPDNTDVAWDLALLQLLIGNFEAGWAGREALWRRATPPDYPSFPQPRWHGERPVAGKTVLVYAEEGFGDTIHFVRYVPLLAARGARVILAVAASVCSLLDGVAGVTQCLSRKSTTWPEFDLHCPISSLPLIFKTRLETIPAHIPYLPAPAPARIQVWEDRLGPRTRPRVGLVWCGNPLHKNDHNRSVPLQTLSRLFDADATFVSLQKEPRPEDKASLRARRGIVDLTDHLTDFVETAALLACLDLVITVDTSVAHLAGALGRPTWILLPYTPDYRWLLDRDDSPWYPTARLFRQTEARDYASVLDAVRSELEAMIAAGRTGGPG
ncbi:tetratricopeptide repeat protein [Bradyrhizobium sp.]|uniref:tetratricopeptide repeat-containing glycosyltransferase family protein n=1 Tax=Bradyrhizobium sp. TaxID=376 RepID=UPI003C630C8B